MAPVDTPTRHTQGPWTLQPATQGSSVEHRDHIGNTLVLAYVYGENAGSMANARLIAAAPEMAEALRLFVSTLAPDFPAGGVLREASDKARTLLASIDSDDGAR